MKPKLAIVTGNTMKFEELSAKLGEFFECEQKDLIGYHEIQGTSEDILMHKLMAAYEAFKMSVLVDDVSMYFDLWNGFPGPYIKSFLELVHPYELGARFAGEHVKITCRLGIAFSPTDTLVSEGNIFAKIVPAKEGEEDIMHFDVCVQIDGMDRRMHDYPLEEKNTFSHRGLAMEELLKRLAERTK